MTNVRLEYQERKDDINKYFKLLKDLAERNGQLLFPNESGLIETPSADVIAILKSGFFLALYNCVESTTTNCLNRIIRELTSVGCKYKDLNIPLKSIYVASVFGRLTDNKLNPSEKTPLLIETIDYVAFERSVNLELKTLLNKNTGGTYSGSLDAKLVRDIFTKFGVNITDLKCNELKKIKDTRNKLGHGEVSFNSCCNQITMQYVEKSKDNLFAFFDCVIDRVDDYITRSLYLSSNFVPFDCSTEASDDA